MGGFNDVSGWEDLDAVTAKVKTIPGLTPTVRIETSESMHKAIQNENDVAKRAALIQKFTGLITGAATGGIGGLFKAAISLA